MNIWWIEDIEFKEGATGEYMVAHYKDGEGKTGKQNVFQPEHQQLFRQSHDEKLAIEVTREKQGNFHNLVEAKLVKEAMEQKGLNPDEPAPVVSEPRTTARAVARGTDDKNRSFALAYAKDIVVASIQPSEKITMNHFKMAIKGAVLLDKWLCGDLELTDEDLADTINKFNKAT